MFQAEELVKKNDQLDVAEKAPELKHQSTQFNYMIPVNG